MEPTGRPPSDVPPPPATLPDEAPGSLVPIRIPGYELIRELHRGGQGTVYEAIQNSTRRHVAVKVLHAGLSERSRRRFQQEAEILARLRHPSVVVVHDSGESGGHAWLAMELVAGLDLDEHVRRERPPVETIVRLVAETAEAVHHVHLRGIIHRDLKPSNVRIAADGSVKVLDFGIAADVTGEGRSITATGDFVGTLAYAAPERLVAQDRDVVPDVRSDVYALGVILYEMLCGKRPHADAAEMAAFSQGTTDVTRPRTLVPELPEDLETIVMRCLAREPERRYDSAAALAADLRAFVAGEPIAARRDGALELLRRQARRYRVAALVGVAAAVLIAAAAAAALVQRARALDAERLAEINAAEARREARVASSVRDFVLGIFEAADVTRTGRTDIPARELVQLGRSSLATVPEDDPETRGELSWVLGKLHARLDLRKEADELFRQALEVESSQHEPDHPHVTRVHMGIADLRWSEKRYDEALAAVAAAREGGDELHPGDARLLTMLEASVLHEQGRSDAALALVAPIMERLPETPEAERPPLLEQHARILIGASRFDEAVAALESAIALEAARAVPRQGFLSTCATLLGTTLIKMERPADAEPHLREALRLQEQIFGAGSRKAALAHSNLAVALRPQEKYAEAEEHARAAIAIADGLGENTGITYAISLTNLAGILAKQARKPEAIELLERAVDTTRAAQPAGHPMLCRQLMLLGGELTVVGRLKEAEARLNEAVAVATKVHGADAPQTASARTRLARALVELGDLDGARREVDGAEAIFAAHGGELLQEERASLQSTREKIAARRR